MTPATGGTAPATVSPTVTFSEPVTLGGAAIIARLHGQRRRRPSRSPGARRTWTVDPVDDLARQPAPSPSAALAGHRRRHQRPAGHHERRRDVARSRVADSCAGGYTPIPQLQGSGRHRGAHRHPHHPWRRRRRLRGPVARRCAASTSRTPPATVTRPPPTRIFVFNGGGGDLVAARRRRARHRQRRREPGPDPDLGDRRERRRRAAPGTVAPTDVTLPMASATAFERYEGMLVRMPQELTVTEHFQLGRFGQVLLSSGGRLQQPTNVVAPGAAANALQAQNDLNQLIVDDASQAPEPRPDRVRPRRPAAQREQHAARRRHRHRHRRRHDLHLGGQRRQRQRLPRCARSTRSAASVDFTAGQPAARRSPRTSAVTCASSA